MRKLLYALAAVGLDSVWGQVSACPEKSVPASMMVDVRLGSGSAIAGLGVNDFVITGKGIVGGIREVKAEAPMDLLILVEPHNRKSFLSGAIPLFLGELDPEDRLAVFHFGTGVDRKTGWERDWSSAEKALADADKGIQLQAVRPLNAVVEGLRMFSEQPEAGRKRFLLLIGDDRDWSTPVRWEAVLANLLDKRVALSVVIDPPRGRVMGNIVPKINVTPGNVGDVRAGETQGRFGLQSVSRIAEGSGGDALAPNGVWFLEEMAKRMKERYLITYCSEKRDLRRPPGVALTAAALDKHPGAVVTIPGGKR
jgi:hypothetical protein